MTTISYTEARDKFAAIWDETAATREPIALSRRGHKSVVLVPLEEWEGLQETQEHRLVYQFTTDKILFAQARYHY